MPDFALVALPGAYHSSVGALLDSFALARDRIEQVFSVTERTRMETRLRILSMDGGAATLDGGIVLRADGAIDGDDPYAFIWLPAFRVGGPEALAARIARTRPVQAWLRRQADRGALIGASGAAVTLLIAAGLTAGVAVPVAGALRPLVGALFPRQPIEERPGLTERGGLLLTSGLGYDLTLMVRAAERTLSPDIARWLSAVIGFDPVADAPAVADPLVTRAQLWLEQRYAGPIALSDMAAAVSTSQATLNRHFVAALGVSPNAYVQRLRFESACRMLEKTSRPIDRIAQLVGYSDSRLFRAMFRRHAGMTATAWRTVARQAANARDGAADACDPADPPDPIA